MARPDCGGDGDQPSGDQPGDGQPGDGQPGGGQQRGAQRRGKNRTDWADCSIYCAAIAIAIPLVDWVGEPSAWVRVPVTALTIAVLAVIGDLTVPRLTAKMAASLERRHHGGTGR